MGVWEETRKVIEAGENVARRRRVAVRGGGEAVKREAGEGAENLLSLIWRAMIGFCFAVLNRWCCAFCPFFFLPLPALVSRLAAAPASDFVGAIGQGQIGIEAWHRWGRPMHTLAVRSYVRLHTSSR